MLYAGSSGSRQGGGVVVSFLVLLGLTRRGGDEDDEMSVSLLDETATPEETTNLRQVTDKLSHTVCTQSQHRPRAAAV